MISVGREMSKQLHDLSANTGVLTRLEVVVKEALLHYDVDPSSIVTLLNVSENATYLVQGSHGKYVMRVHRLRYHSLTEIASELAWLEALKSEAVVNTPPVISSRRGEKVVSISFSGELRHCVMFGFVQGAELLPLEAGEAFVILGELAAKMHGHAKAWTFPSAFRRFSWDLDASFGKEARWGSYKDGISVDSELRALFERAESNIRSRLLAYGTDSSRFGLIHADMRLSNLLWNGSGEVCVIDFDDCGFGWYFYDLAAALSFIEHRPEVPKLIAAWMEGYRKFGTVSKVDEDEIETFVMMRRLLLIGWIGSHSVADISKELGGGYTTETAALAENYLSRWNARSI